MADNFFGLTDAGKLRDNNEDNFIAQATTDKRFIIGSVIDGVGGYEGGEVASELARTSILNFLKSSLGDNIPGTLKKAVLDANQKIIEEKKLSCKYAEMACVLTLVIADINNNKFYYAHVGDTRLYLFRDNSSLVKVSHDHSFVGYLEDSGRISEEAAMQHPKRNEINKALGFDDDKILVEPDFIETGESPFLPGDVLLLCSDGLSDMIDSKTITGILNAPGKLKDISTALIDAANQAGGKDNITVVIIKNDKQPTQHQATKPVASKKDEDQKIEPTVVEKTSATVQKPVTPKKKTSFTGLICIFLLLALAGFLYKDFFSSTNEIKTNALPLIKNVLSQRLQDNINNTTGKEIALNEILGGTKNVTINDSLNISKDSIYINGNGVTLVSDSSFNGAAMVFSDNCKYIVMDSITFQNFNIALLVNNKSLHLKNVQFVNCRYPVLMSQLFQNSRDNSVGITDSVHARLDSAKTRSSK
ncbi:MAG: serine/threonine-protein phosphatase [Bacteroidetes bacterium]|nr:serine/threonine-protein phosphatase [Bacteroidota bacterium]